MTISNMAYMSSSYRNLYINQTKAASSLNKLSSGYRINSAADDAAGLAVSEKMRGQISGMDMAYRNTMNAVSMVQTAEGSLDSTSQMLVRMKELAVQASNGTYTDEQRAYLNTEFNQLKEEMNRIAGTTDFNGIKLLDGSLGATTGSKGVEAMGISGISVGGTMAASGNAKFSISQEDDGTFAITAQIGDETVRNVIDSSATGTTFSLSDGTNLSLNFSSTAASLKEGTISNVGVKSGSSGTDISKAKSADSNSSVAFQVGANSGADQKINMHIGDMSATALGLWDIDISTADGATAAIEAIDNASSQVVSQRGTLGATQNRLEHTLNNLAVSRDNLVDAESTIRDVDMALEMMRYTQSSMMVQTAQAMLSQGMNLTQQTMLALLR